MNLKQGLVIGGAIGVTGLVIALLVRKRQKLKVKTVV